MSFRRVTVEGVIDDPWRDKLTAAEFKVLRQGGTEAPFTGEYTDTETTGVYCCRACGAELFSSTTKFHSGCGWPSFADADSAAVTVIEDRSLGMVRTEVRCAGCDSHLGHLFTGEGIAPQGLPDQRYCINSISLTLRPTG
jgi:peptide-methionine (R)-S-oxide reductase